MTRLAMPCQCCGGYDDDCYCDGGEGPRRPALPVAVLCYRSAAGSASFVEGSAGSLGDVAADVRGTDIEAASPPFRGPVLSTRPSPRPRADKQPLAAAGTGPEFAAARSELGEARLRAVSTVSTTNAPGGLRGAVTNVAGSWRQN